MKNITLTDMKRLEAKINLLNDKLDVLMESQGVQLKKSEEMSDKEEQKKRKARERQQSKLLREQNFKRHLDQMMEDRRLQYTDGLRLQKQFNLLLKPSASRIREYLKTNDPKAFNGLKRNN